MSLPHLEKLEMETATGRNNRGCFETVPENGKIVRTPSGNSVRHKYVICLRNCYVNIQN